MKTMEELKREKEEFVKFMYNEKNYMNCDECPENQREHTQHIVGVQRHRMMTGKTFAQSVERTGPDIAINHPDRCHQHANRLGV